MYYTFENFINYCDRNNIELEPVQESFIDYHDNMMIAEEGLTNIYAMTKEFKKELSSIKKEISSNKDNPNIQLKLIAKAKEKTINFKKAITNTDENNFDKIIGYISPVINVIIGITSLAITVDTAINQKPENLKRDGALFATSATVFAADQLNNKYARKKHVLYMLDKQIKKFDQIENELKSSMNNK